MADQLNRDLENLLDLFKSIEPLQKSVESRGNGLDGPALNETRNATYHLLCALRADTEKERGLQIGKAERHAQRAIYDCHEAILLGELDRLRSFKESYAGVVITSVIQNWLELLIRARDAQKLIIEARESNGENRDVFYDKVSPHVAVLTEINDVCEMAREELNKAIENENKEKIRFSRETRAIWVGLIIGVLGISIAIAAWLLPVK